MDFTSPKNKNSSARKTIADTVDRVIMPKVEYIDEHPDEFPWDVWKEFTSLGYLGLRYLGSRWHGSRALRLHAASTRNWRGHQQVSPWL